MKFAFRIKSDEHFCKLVCIKKDNFQFYEMQSPLLYCEINYKAVQKLIRVNEFLDCGKITDDEHFQLQ